MVRGAGHAIHLCTRPQHQCCAADTSEFLDEPLHVATWMLHSRNGTQLHSPSQLEEVADLRHYTAHRDDVFFRCFRCGAIEAHDDFCAPKVCLVCDQRVCPHCWDAVRGRCNRCSEHLDATRHPASNGRCPLCDNRSLDKHCHDCNRRVCMICFDDSNQRCTECVEYRLQS